MNNSTHEISTTLQGLHFYFHFVYSFLYLVCFLVNLLTIVAVVKFEILNKKPTNVLILCLSIADSLLGKWKLTFKEIDDSEQKEGTQSGSDVHRFSNGNWVWTVGSVGNLW